MLIILILILVGQVSSQVEGVNNLDLKGIELQIVAKLVGRKNYRNKLSSIIVDVGGDDAVFELNTIDGVDLEMKGLERKPQKYLKDSLEEYIKVEMKIDKKYKIRDFVTEYGYMYPLIPEVFEFSTTSKNVKNVEKAEDSILVISGMATTDQKSQDPSRQTLPRGLLLPGADMCIWLSRSYVGHLFGESIKISLAPMLRGYVQLDYNSSGSLFSNRNTPKFQTWSWDIELIKLNVTANSKLTIYLKAKTDWESFWTKDIRYTLESTAYVYVKPDGEGIKFDFVKGPNIIDPNERRNSWWQTAAGITPVAYFDSTQLDFKLESFYENLGPVESLAESINLALKNANMEIPYLEEADAQVSHAGLSTSGQMYLCMNTV
eukprot:TRINITY_DN116_c0_g1_i5.p1 TRINITY_DN116_c0_g1~~TRINITY_DN116_c0_g1_i5.p1  ORF type:complete len:405 (-),score=23.35 TRINITY_DN116_c0_g1_i5:375-1502(-)